MATLSFCFGRHASIVALVVLVPELLPLPLVEPEPLELPLDDAPLALPDDVSPEEPSPEALVPEEPVEEPLAEPLDEPAGAPDEDPALDPLPSFEPLPGEPT
jgi:hypothetical protein